MNIDHTARAHARMSASKIARVAVCPGSLLAEEGLPNSTSEAAQRGTDIHEIAEKILRQQPITDVDDDMLAIASKYVTTAMYQTSHAKKHYIELDVTDALKSIHPSLGGTADLVSERELQACIDVLEGLHACQDNHNYYLYASKTLRDIRGSK